MHSTRSCKWQKDGFKKKQTKSSNYMAFFSHTEINFTILFSSKQISLILDTNYTKQIFFSQLLSS